MKIIIIVIQLVLVSFLFSNSIYAQSPFEKAINGLKHEKAYRRASAVKSLAKLKDKRAVAPLIVALKDENSKVRQRAVQALGILKDKRAAAPLIEVLKSGHSKIRPYAAKALGKLGDKRAVMPLIAVVKDGARNIAIALDRVANGHHVSALSSVVAKNSRLRVKAALALGLLGDKRAIDPLTAALKQANLAYRPLYKLRMGRDVRAIESALKKLRKSSEK